jgi:hypothetical protein
MTGSICYVQHCPYCISLIIYIYCSATDTARAFYLLFGGVLAAAVQRLLPLGWTRPRRLVGAWVGLTRIPPKDTCRRGVSRCSRSRLGAARTTRTRDTAEAWVGP